MMEGFFIMCNTIAGYTIVIAVKNSSQTDLDELAEIKNSRMLAYARKYRSFHGLGERN